MTVAARADDCNPSTGLSPCIDADVLRLPAGHARFLSIPAGDVIAPRQYGFAAGLSYLSRPILLLAASADPEGREIAVVRDAFDLSLLFAYGAAERLELTVATPFTLYQRGAGVQGVTSQNGPPIDSSVVRDPRIGAAFALIRRKQGLVSAKSRLEITLPFGDEQSFAGESTFGVAPGFVLDVRKGAFFAGSEIGARLRPITELAGTRIGSQIVVSAGLGADLLGRLLTVTGEAFILPTLASQNHSLPNGARIDQAQIVPAEALGSIASSPTPDWTFQLGAGVGLPLSSARRVDPDGSTTVDHFAAPTTPRFRFVFVIRYAPNDSDTSRGAVRKSAR